MARRKSSVPIETPEEFQHRVGQSIEPPPSAGEIPPAPAGSDQTPDPPPRTEPLLIGTAKQRLTHELTPDEIRIRSMQLVMVLNREIPLEENRQAQVKEDLKATMQQLMAKQRTLAKAVELGIEEADVEVQSFLLQDNETVSEVRMDTGKAYNTRKASDHERQGDLFKAQAEELFREDRERAARDGDESGE